MTMILIRRTSNQEAWLRDHDCLAKLIEESCGKGDNPVVVTFMKRVPDKVLPHSMMRLISHYVRKSIEKTLKVKLIPTVDHRVTIIYGLRATEVKRVTMEFEQRDPFGTFVDVDVFYKGKPITRVEIEHKPRSCFICGSPAKQCIASNSHSLKEVQQAIRKQFFYALLNSIITRDQSGNDY